MVYRLRARPGLVLDAGSAVAGLFRCRDDAGGARSVVRGRRGTDGFRSWSAVTVGDAVLHGSQMNAATGAWPREG